MFFKQTKIFFSNLTRLVFKTQENDGHCLVMMEIELRDVAYEV